MKAVGLEGITQLLPAADPELLRWVHYVLSPTVHFDWQDYLTAHCAEKDITPMEILQANCDRMPQPIPWSPAEVITAPCPDVLDPKTKELRNMWEKWSRTWNNRKSDSLALCAHIKADGDIFVTANTHDFQRNLQKLRIWFPNLCILEPEEALREVQAMSKK